MSFFRRTSEIIYCSCTILVKRLFEPLDGLSVIFFYSTPLGIAESQIELPICVFLFGGLLEVFYRFFLILFNTVAFVIEMP